MWLAHLFVGNNVSIATCEVTELSLVLSRQRDGRSAG